LALACAGAFVGGWRNIHTKLHHPLVWAWCSSGGFDRAVNTDVIKRPNIAMDGVFGGFYPSLVQNN
jgi:hypothetical protein